MKVLFAVDRVQDWPFELPGSSVVTARAYLTDPDCSKGVDAQLINLTRTGRYQGRGYYVSLLAEARGHRPLPNVKTIEDLQSKAHLELLAREVDVLAQRALHHDESSEFELAAYFGRDAAERHAALAQQLFHLVRAPLLRAHFERDGARWRLVDLKAMAAADVPPQHRSLLLRAAAEYVTGRRTDARTLREPVLPRLAILRDATENDPPSNPPALERFVAAAGEVGLQAELIGPRDIDRLGEFDGLFIRATTNVSHYTYEFSRQAAALGLVVIDDPDSILKCSNKVYLHELMSRHQIPTPRTMTVHRENLGQVVQALGLPCILKQPDSAFSLGVVKIDSEAQLQMRALQLLERSELLIAQQWLPTEFDWRVCVLDRRPLLVCRYFMAPGHWQVIKRESANRQEGAVQTLCVAEAPEAVVSTAVRAANLIGSGLYGVDLKQVANQCYLIEVNDNPNIDAGNEDRVLKNALYREILGVFSRRIGETRRMVHAV
jgi:glutathione synthase/RimK-type ligase-like ATP-grasp enzyme